MIKDILSCGPEIKTAYEGQPNTNAFTDAERAKLAGLTDSSVTTVFGRSGAVTAQNGDYTAAQVTNVPAGSIVAENVQDAVNELESDISSLAAATGTALNAKYDASNPAGYVSAAGAAAAAPVQSVAGRTGAVTLAKADVGLPNVDNTSDANKPVSTAQQAALNLKANLASPTFTGTVSGITAAMVGAPSGSGTSSGTNTGDQTSVTGNAGSATVLQTSRNINGVAFNGSADITLPVGKTVQVVYAPVTAGSSQAVGVVPTDNTIPQITEGNEFFTATINGAVAGNIIEIECVAYMCLSDIYNGGVNSLFVGSTANALASTFWPGGGSASPLPVRVYAEYTVPSNGNYVFRLRSGAVNAGKTIYLNSTNAGASLLGGAITSYLKLTERKP